MKVKIKKAIVILAWLCIFEVIAALVNNSILLVGPIKVLQRILELLFTADFYAVCLMSFGRIMLGMTSAFLSGLVFGYLMYRYPWFEDIWAPVLSVMKAIPVASFVVLLLIWQGAGRLSIFICFFVVFPNVCVSMKSGLCAVDTKMSEMAYIYEIRGVQKWLYIYRPIVLPYLISCMEIAVGMSFKSGVAAEVIGTPDFSVGERIYVSKVYLDTAGLFAWTLALILMSFLAEKIILWGMKQGLKPLKAVTCGYRQETKEERAVSVQTENVKNDECVTNKGLGDDSANYKITNKIKIEHLGKSYGGHTVFKDLSLTLNKGDCYCLTAPSGSGKTTLFRIMTGLTKPDGGMIVGADAYTYLFQEDRFAEDELTINNIMLTANKCGLSLSDVLSMTAGLLPEEALFLPIRALSGGMKRRAALIRAILYQYDNPEAVCLLDEPFSGLDDETKKSAVEFILKYRQGRTLIIATHEEISSSIFHKIVI